MADKKMPAGDNRSEGPSTPQEWRKWKEERNALKRKWREATMIKELEKLQEKEAESVKKPKIEHVETNSTGRQHTVSIAIPGSILDNAQSPELRTYLAGQIARAAVVFNVDEIVIFDETGTKARTLEGEFTGIGKKGNANIQMARILQYLECPQYLRKAFFPQHPDLKYAGLLNPLDSPHHMRAEDDSEYREGVTLDKPVRDGRGSFVDVGQKKEWQVDKHLQPGVRVTVRKDHSEGTVGKKLKGTVVPPTAPRTERGIYWGYTVRLASSLGAVFTGCPYKAGYDLTVGTSDKGDTVDTFEMDKFSHMLVVFGGLKGLEASLDADQDLHVEEPSLLFTHYINTCPDQGSATIRTEEAILITLAALRPKVTDSQKR